MKKGLKIFVFVTTMLLTVGGFKAMKHHRYAMYQNGKCGEMQMPASAGNHCHSQYR